MFAANGCKSVAKTNERKRKGENKRLSDWNAMRSDGRGRVHVCVRDSGQQRLLENRNLETWWRSMDVRHEKWAYGLEMVVWTEGRYAASKAS